MGANAHTRFQHEKAPNAIFARLQRWAWLPEVPWVPEVDTCLICHFNRGVNVSQQGTYPRLSLRFSGGAQVGGVEIEQVVVFDALARPAPTLQVPDRLEQAASHQLGIGELQVLPSRQDGGIDRVLQDILTELGFGVSVRGCESWWGGGAGIGQLWAGSGLCP